MVNTTNIPSVGNYIRNGFGSTFQIIEKTEKRTSLKDFYTGKELHMSTSVFEQLWKNKNYDTVRNPESIREKMDSASIASRFLIK
jgi:hypothetical protein